VDDKQLSYLFHVFFICFLQITTLNLYENTPSVNPELLLQSNPIDCEDFIYERGMFTDTITMDLNLVCDGGGDFKQHFLGTLVT
jgi:hypothetical protein